MSSICGAECAGCPTKDGCRGCRETGGRPFGEECLVARYCLKGEGALEAFREKLIAAFNALGIPDMEEVTQLHALKGSVVNLPYPLPNGQTVRLWDDNKIYLANQLSKKNSDRCYGIAADERYLVVAECDRDGGDAELVVFQRWDPESPE